MLEHASRSRGISTLIAFQPPLGGSEVPGSRPRSWPSGAAHCRQLQQAGRRERTRSFDRRSKAGIDLAASAITLGMPGDVRLEGEMEKIQV